MDIKVINFGTNRKRVYIFLLVVNSNLEPILHRLYYYNKRYIFRLKFSAYSWVLEEWLHDCLVGKSCLGLSAWWVSRVCPVYVCAINNITSERRRRKGRDAVGAEEL